MTFEWGSTSASQGIQEDPANVNKSGHESSERLDHVNASASGDQEVVEDDRHGVSDNLLDVPKNEDDPGEWFWCSLCDDGGTILFCEGPCLRSFHACLSDKNQHKCRTLGFTEEQYKDILKMLTWLCPNCKAEEQICFVCHELGKSAGVDQKVFKCHSAHCGRFYHPDCYARAMREHVYNTKDADDLVALADSVKQNETFVCLQHVCSGCGMMEDAVDLQSLLAKCRQCPSAWHFQCLPYEVTFEDQAYARGLPQRAWEVAINDNNKVRVGIYCPKHDVDVEADDMVKFPPNSSFNRSEGLDPLHEGTSTGNVKQKTKWVQSYEGERQRDIENSVREIIAKSEKEKTAEKVKEALCMPRSYVDTEDEKFIYDGEWSSFEESAKRAVIWQQEKKSTQQIHALFPAMSLNKVIKAERALEVFLKPWLFGPPDSSIGRRLTSFGRHFIKKDILIEIVNKLQWHIEEGDTIVDFCCGSGEFSVEMRRKLEEAGKECQFKNYDLFATKEQEDKQEQNFSIQQREWCTVELTELPPGNKLIMGLNPPLSLAHKFIQHALKFKPKILILIVLPSTESLQRYGYELVWKDADLLKGNTGNHVTPILYLWSRKSAARSHSQISKNIVDNEPLGLP